MSKALVCLYQQAYVDHQQEQVNRINLDFITKGRPIKDWQTILIPDGIWKRDTKSSGKSIEGTHHASTGRWPALM